jgi:hypothetical protein
MCVGGTGWRWLQPCPVHPCVLRARASHEAQNGLGACRHVGVGLSSTCRLAAAATGDSFPLSLALSLLLSGICACCRLDGGVSFPCCPTSDRESLGQFHPPGDGLRSSLLLAVTSSKMRSLPTK